MTFTDTSLTGKIFPEDETYSGITADDADFSNAGYLGALASAESRAYAPKGLDFTPDFGAGDFDLSPGLAYIEDPDPIDVKLFTDSPSTTNGTWSEGFTVVVEVEAETGVPLQTTSGRNYVYLFTTRDSQNDVQLRVSDTEADEPSSPSLKIGEIDAGGNTQQPNNRSPDAVGVANVKRFGAEGDGVTNDTDAFRKALRSLRQEGGGTLFIPAGTFIVGDVVTGQGPVFDLRKYPPVEITGVGYASHVKVEDGLASGSDAGVSVFRGGNDLNIHNFRVDGNKSNQGTIGDAADGANFVQLGDDVHFHHMWSENSPGDGVEVLGDRPTIDNNNFRDNTEQDVHLFGSDDATVNNNLCIRNQKDGSIRVFSSDTKGGDARGISITDNVIVNPSTFGIQVEQISARTFDSRIEGNLLINPGGTNTAVQEQGMLFKTLTESVVKDNTIVNATSHGIQFSVDAAADISGNVIEDNVVRGCGGHGMKLLDNDSLVVRNNVIKQNDKHGILFSFNLDNMPGTEVQSLRCSDNEILDNNQGTDDTNNGIQLFVANGPLNRPILDGNDIRSPTATRLHQRGVSSFIGSGGSIDNFILEDNRVLETNGGRYALTATSTFQSIVGNYPRRLIDVRELTGTEFGQRASHDGSGTGNPQGEAQVIPGSGFVSLVDGTNIT